MPATVELWFDFSCPYAYLASQRAPALDADRSASAGPRSTAAAQCGVSSGVSIDWRPMLLGGVFRGIGAGDGPMASLPAAKATYNAQDMTRWAERLGVPLTIPAAHPMRTVRALRTLLAVPHARWPRAIAQLFAAYWQRGEDVTRDDVIAAALARASVPDAEIRDAAARADSEAIKAELRARTDEAIALGVFGAPAWVFRRAGREPILIWGQDRMPWVEAVLAGWDPDAGGPCAPTVIPDRLTGTIDAYVDAASPYSYFGLTQLAPIAAAGVTIRLRPILVGSLFRAIGTPAVPLFALSDAKQRYIRRELVRWGNWLGVPFRWPTKFPQVTLAAQRATLAAAPLGFDAQLRLAIAFGRAMWAEDRDLEDPATVRAVIAESGLPATLADQTADPAIKAALIAQGDAARAAGVFGVPTWAVNGQLLWGQDRLALAIDALVAAQP